MSLPTSTQGCRPWFLGDGHRHRPVPSGMRVGWQPRPRLRPNRPLVKTNQRNAASAPVNNPGSSSIEGLATAPPGDNSSKAKSKKSPSPMWPTAQVPVPATTWANGAALAKSAASAAIVQAVDNALGWQRVDGDDGPERVCERGAHSDPRALSSFLWPFIHFFLSFFSWIDPIDRPIVRGSTLDGISCAGVAYVGTLVYLP